MGHVEDYGFLTLQYTTAPGLQAPDGHKSDQPGVMMA